MFGSSVYMSQDLESIFSYLDEMKSCGAKTIFTSMHIAEDDNEKAKNSIIKVSNKINENGLELMIDISSGTLTKYEMTLDEMMDFLYEIHVKSLRVDYGFDFNEIKKLSEKFNIVLNASTIDDNYCDSLVNAGLVLSDITVCHNFYPRPETGLSKKFLLEKNRYLKDKGFKIQAFIPGNEEKRGPLFEGLPTLEEHRDIDPFVAYLELVSDFFVDEVLVGDLRIKEETLRKILKFENEKIIELRVEKLEDLSDEISTVFWGMHKNRKDYSDYVLRSTMTRIQIKEKIEPENNVERKIGTITLDNKNYQRYNGELQIAMRNLNADDRVNVIGNIVDEDIILMKYIKDDVRFIFVR